MHIYIHTYVEMIDCSESDSMIEKCGKLDKSKTLLKFRLVGWLVGFMAHQLFLGHLTPN